MRLNRDDWSREIAAARREAENLGRVNPNIRIQTNSTQAVAQLGAVAAAERRVSSEAAGAHKPIISLASALAMIAPAALPITAVAGGALAGLVPTLATVALGVAGVKDEMKSGALIGTQYGRDLNQISKEADRLKTIAAGGLLSGLDRGLATSRPLFHEVNSDVRLMSDQIGNVAAGGAPALLRILTQLNPLFVTFGGLMTRGAHELEHWAETSTGVTSFVGYVQQELPEVMQFLGHLAVLFSHVVQAAAPFGGVVLSDITLLVRALDALPIPVLQALVPLLVSARMAMLGWRGTEAIINAVSRAIAKVGPSQETAAARTAYANAQIRADEALTAAAVARAEAEKARTAEEGAAQTYAALAGTGTALEDEALAAVAAANQFSLAMQAQADAATAAAETTAAEATAAAEASAAAGETAAIGWTAALGPVAALGIGLGLLTTVFGRNDQAAEQNSKIMQGYAESLRQSTDGLAAANTKQTIKNLQDEKAIGLLRQLHDANEAVGVSQTDLVLAVNAGKQSYDGLEATLHRIALANSHLVFSPGSPYNAASTTREYNKTGQSALNLAGKIKTLHDSFTAQQKQQMLATQIERAAQAAIDGTANAATFQAHQLGLSRNAYLDAQIAARKNTSQTREQTAAYQAENDAASLLQAALDKLNGKTLDISDAQISAASALQSVNQGLKQNHDAWNLSTQAGVTNQQNVNQSIRAYQQLGEAISGGTKLTIAGKQAILNGLGALKQDLEAHHADADAIGRVNQQIEILKNTKIPKVRLEIDTSDALARVRQIISELHGLSGAEQQVGLNNVEHALSLPGRASGGGLPEGVSAVGERGPELVVKQGAAAHVLSNAQSKAFLAATGMRAPGFAGGTGGNERAIWNYLLRAGLSPREDAGVMGNIERESGFDPQASNGTHFGIVQWDSGRWARVQSIARSMGVSPWTLGPQLKALVEELHGPYRSVLTGMSHAHSAARAAGIFNHGFEVSGDYGGVRAGYASDIIDRFRGTGPTSGSGGDGGSQHVTPRQRRARREHGIRKRVADQRATFRSQQHPHQIIQSNGNWYYNGESYESEREAAEARREDQVTARQDAAKRGRETIQRTIRKGGAEGIASMIRSEIPDSKKAMADLAKAVDDAFKLKGVKGEITDARTRLNNMLGYRSQTESTYASNFDPTQYGTIGGLVNGLMGAAGANNGIAAEIRKLRGEHLNKNYLSQLVASGNTTTLGLLAGGSQRDIAQVNKALGRYNASLSGIGNAAVVQKFGESVAHQRHDINQLIDHEKRLMTKIERLTEKVSELDKRQTVIMLDGKVIARATAPHHAKDIHHQVGRRP